MLRFTLRQIEYAVAVQNSGSLVEAARTLGIAQPSISAAIVKLEAQLDLQLFIRRHAQGVTTTAQGASFLANARNLLAQARDLQDMADASSSSFEGTLAVGSFMTLAPAFVPQIIASFRKLYPKVHFRFEEGNQTWLYDGLRSGDFDVALLYELDVPKDICVQTLAKLPPYVLLPANHPLASDKTVALSALATTPFVLLDVVPSKYYFLRLLKEAGVNPSIAFASPSIEMVRGLVGQGLGFSLLTTRPHSNFTYDGQKLTLCEISEKVELGKFGLATLAQLRKTKLVEAFERHCLAHFTLLDYPRQVSLKAPLPNDP